MVVDAITKASAGAEWYRSMLDASNTLWSKEAGDLIRTSINVKPTSQVEPGEFAREKLSWTCVEDVRTDHGAFQKLDGLLQQLRCHTGRHDQCTKAYCLRKHKDNAPEHKDKTKTPPPASNEAPSKPGSKVAAPSAKEAPEEKADLKCRFAEGLRIRDYPVERAPGCGFTAPSHYYAEAASTNDGKPLVRWRFYVGDKTDPAMNSCHVTHARCFMSNCDAKACLDKYGLVNYVTKVAGYVCKAEKSSKAFAGLLSAALENAKPGQDAHAPFRKVLFNIIARDFSSQETCFVDLDIKPVHCSHDFRYCNWQAKAREVVPGKKKGNVVMKLSDRECYLQRHVILDNSKPKLKADMPGFYNMMNHAMQCNFLEFYRCYSCTFCPSTPAKDPIVKRYQIDIHPDADRKIAKPTPDLPPRWMDPEDPKHEEYCAYRLFILRPIANNSEYDRLVREYHSAWETHPDKDRYGAYHLAYEAFMEDRGSGVQCPVRLPNGDASDAGWVPTKRAENIIDMDSRGVHNAIDLKHEDDGEKPDLTPSDAPASTEKWMQFVSRQQAEGAVADTAKDQSYWDGINMQYATHPDYGNIGGDWVSYMATTWSPPPVAVPAVALAPLVRLQDEDLFNDLNDEQKAVVARLFDYHKKWNDFMEDPSAHPKPTPVRMIVYGLGGTGKSYVLRAFKRVVDRYAAGRAGAKTSKDLVCAMAPSAVAAVGVGGETIQRTCHFPRSEGTDQTYPEDLTMSKEKLELLEDQHANYHYYFIDEFGMVGAQTHGVLSTRLRQAKLSKLHVDDNSDVYGGSCVILFGHHAQLPPVSDPTAYDQLEKPKKPLTEHMKRGRALLKSEFSEVVILRRQMRQQLHVPGPEAPLTEEQKAQNTETKWFVGFLSRLMDGAVSGDDYWKLKAHNEAHSHAPSSDFDSFQLCASYEEKTNKNAQIAANFARSKGVPLVPIHAINAGAPFARVAEARAARNLEPVLYLAKGVRVMSTWNGWQAQGVVNGAMGIVHEIIFKIGEGPGSMPEAVLVQFPEGGFYTGPSFLEGPGLERIVKFTPRTEKFTDRHFKSCSRTQFPLQLAHALTIHKSQGMALGCVVLSLGVKEFCIGLSYVGASRVRSFGDLFFDPMPLMKRFTSYADSAKMKSRKLEEEHLEVAFLRATLDDLERRKQGLSALSETARLAAVKRLVSGDDLCFVPSGWKFTNAAPSPKPTATLFKNALAPTPKPARASRRELLQKGQKCSKGGLISLMEALELPFKARRAICTAIYDKSATPENSLTNVNSERPRTPSTPRS